MNFKTNRRTKTKLYAAYGSNINPAQMAYRCPNARPVGTGFIEDYRLTFRRGGYANVESAKGERVPVLLWRITDECERSLDRYEGYPRFYMKEYAAVNGRKALVYVMTPGARGDFELPSRSYYKGIETGYRDARLPKEYLTAAKNYCAKEAAKCTAKK